MSTPAASQETAAQKAALPHGGTLRVDLVDWARHELQYASPDGRRSTPSTPRPS